MLIVFEGDHRILSDLDVFLQASSIKLKMYSSKKEWLRIELTDDVDINTAELERDGTLSISVRLL